MFTVHGMKQGDCQGNSKHSDKMCYEAECLKGTFRGLLCPKCFEAQVSMRSASNGKKEPSLLDGLK